MTMYVATLISFYGFVKPILIYSTRNSNLTLTFLAIYYQGLHMKKTEGLSVIGKIIIIHRSGGE